MLIYDASKVEREVRSNVEVGLPQPENSASSCRVSTVVHHTSYSMDKNYLNSTKQTGDNVRQL